MKITTNDEGLVIELHGKEQLWSLRAKIVVSASTISSIRHDEVFQDWRKWEVRMPGTNAPKLLLAGSYWTEEGWDFIYAKKPVGIYKQKLSDVLVVETDQNKYKRLIISLDRTDSEAIIKWWQKINRKISKK